MTSIDKIRTLSFYSETPGEDLTFNYLTLIMPHQWLEMIRKLKDAASKTGTVRYLSVPALNQLLTALFPQLISVEYPNPNKIWLYSREAIDPGHLQMVFSVWLKEEYGRLKLRFPTETDSEIPAVTLNWEHNEKKLLTGTDNKWNTADTVLESFSLLPELLGECISEPGFTIDFNSSSLSFRRAPNQTGRGGSELISWIPETFKNSAYSIYLRFTLQTIPYQSFPVIHLDMGIRRWVSLNETRPPGGSHSVYLLTEFPGSKVATNSRRFQIASIKWKSSEEGFKLIWNNLLPELFERIYPHHTLPTPEELCKKPLNYVSNSGLSAVMAFQNKMPAWQHKVLPGLTPLDRRKLCEQIAPRLYDSFNLIHTEAPERVKGLRFKNIGNVFFPPKLTDKIKEIENNTNRRKAIAQTAGANLRLEIWYLSETVRDALFNRIAQILGFEVPRDVDLSGSHHFNSEELSVQIKFYELEDLANKLDSINSTEKEIKKAVQTRADQVAGAIDSSERSGTGKDYLTGAFIELPGADDFESHTDPKVALRAGFAKTSRFTQFITPKEEGLDHRTKMAGLDLLRQFGVQSGTPSYTSKLFPGTIDYAAFWLFKPRENAQYFVPMFLHMSGETGEVNATAFGFGDFLSYPEFLLSLGTPNKMKILGYSDKEKIPGILKDWLKKVCTGPDLLMMVSAQNARNTWSWLTNPQIGIDQVSFEKDQEMDISNFKGLRIIRVRDAAQSETPEIYAFKEKPDGELQNDDVSFTQGLFQVSERVYYSVGSKPKQRTNLRRLASKADDPDLQAWNPRIIELTAACLQQGDDPKFWTMLAHRLRDSAVQFDDALSLPLPLNLLKSATKYAEIGTLFST